MPIEVEAHTVPHFKAPVKYKVEGLGQEHAGTFMKYNVIVKLGSLVHKMGFEKTEVLMTVPAKIRFPSAVAVQRPSARSCLKLGRVTFTPLICSIYICTL